jgi:hypothetical protein
MTDRHRDAGVAARTQRLDSLGEKAGSLDCLSNVLKKIHLHGTG